MLTTPKRETIHYSDERLKTGIRGIDNPLENILALQGVYFNWTQNAQTELGLDNKTNIGLIAQDVERVFTELVTLDPSGYKQVNYEGLTPILVESIREQQSIIDDLELRISTLELQSAK